MSAVNIARVAVEGALYSFDKEYDYIIPESLTDDVKKGVRVMVPFGKGNKSHFGVVMDILPAQSVKKLKEITAVLDKAPLLSDEMCELVRWLKERTFCTCYDAAKAVLPAGINLKMVSTYVAKGDISPDEIEKLSESEKQIFDFLSERGCYVSRKRICAVLGFREDCEAIDTLAKKGYIIRNDEAASKSSDATMMMVQLTDKFRDEGGKIKVTAKQQSVLNLLMETSSASVKEVCYFLGITPAVVKALENKGLIESYSCEYYRKPYSAADIKAEIKESPLTQEQSDAYEKIKRQYKSGSGVSLLYGVTGSGKTRVFLKLIQDVLNDGRNVIVMVPEISLTPQTINIFRSYFGDDVAVFHSGLSIGERMDEWKRVKRGKAHVAVGTRSAVFAPFENIGMIIMDEEQEHTYKSESSPRYNAREVAGFRCAYNKGVLVLASATPSVETFAAAVKEKYQLCTLKNRYGKSALPKVIVADMLGEHSAGNRSSISRVLKEELQKNLENGRQSILLINRRGYNTFAVCESCKKVVTCPSCSISLTYHIDNGRLMCHYCGYSEPFTSECHECGENAVRYSGAGTQRIEQELSDMFPEARILRMDADTTMTKNAHENAFADFGAGKYDIMIGTQMVAKGLDFENVTLVGVINADQQLYNDDFRSMEQTFSLLTQVIGRSGRGALEGRAVIQTMTPENPIIQLAAKQDYDSFFRSEIRIRRAMIYPPFCDICAVGFVGESDIYTRGAADIFLQQLKDKVKSEYKEQKLIVLGPMAPKIARMSNKYRFHLIIKCKNSKHFRKMISDLIISIMKDSRFKQVSVFADINPYSIF